jgi:hypothetical protein
MPWGYAAAVAGAYLSSKGAKDSANAQKDANQANLDASKMDPRLEGVLYGTGAEGDKGGLLGQYQALGQAPQDPRLQGYGNANLDYLGNASSDMAQIRDTAGGLMSGAGVPKVQATGQAPLAYMHGTMVNANMIDAPSQNSIDLKDPFQRMINGDSAANPYLTGALKGSIGMSEQSMSKMQDDSTRNLMENILPGLRSNSVIAGQYGGSRQGIAEGRAIGDFGREQQRTMENFGNNNTTAAVGAQASEFSRGQDRSLSAMQNLSGSQYGVASQNAAAQNAAASQNAGIANNAEAMNVDRTNNVNADWARRNDAAQVQNQGATMQGATIGAGLLGGQLAGAAGAGTNQDNYDLNRATQTNGLLQPYILKNNNVPAAQPVYSNTGGAALGGAMAGLGIYNQFKQPAQQQQTGGSWTNVQDAWNNGYGFGGSAVH